MDKAAEIKVFEGDFYSALNLYLTSNQPTAAAKILLENKNLLNDETLLKQVVAALLKNEIFNKVFLFNFYMNFFKAGELYEAIGKNEKAMKCYKDGKNFNRAIQVKINYKIKNIDYRWLK